MDGVTAIANILRLEGVEFIGCVPYQPLLEAAAIAGIRPIIFRQEGTGIHMVDGYSRVTNGKKMGVFMMQNGPGAENGFGGVAQAYSESVPILLLPAGMPREKRGVHPNFYPTRSYETITKWSEEMNIVERIPDLMRRAFTKLRTGRPGPVLLEIPQDVATGELPEELFNYEPPRVVLQQADPSDVSRAARALLAADRPIIQAGQGILYAEATPELIELAEFLQAPVMTTLPGKSGFPETHPLSLGSGGPSTTAQVNKYLKESDLVFGAGCSFTKTNFAQAIPQGKIMVHMTNDEDAIGREFKTEFAMLGDAKLVLRQLLDELKSQAGSARPKNHTLQDDIKSTKEAWLAQWMPKLTSDEVPMNPYRVVWDLMHTVDLDNTIITHESGSAREYLSPFWEARAPRSFIGWGKSTQLGYSLGLAMGAKLAAPEKLCVNVMGDLAFSTVGLDIETAVRCEIPTLTIVINNAFMSIYDDSRFPVALEKYNIKTLSGEFSEVAQAMGAYTEKITVPNDIIPSIKRGIAETEAGKAVVLEFITKDEGEYSKF
ncbi:MAG: thiamine pyrophosphate-requiring protein [Dehalococcoidia bacterium]|nr:thiamine pyrophosphate-requiring protein [Dehalococcoidia bacterium]|tara:strand:+ start:593 stop:2230 length:1638 start_codon:yes stop_codon:yes gene_type:complete